MSRSSDFVAAMDAHNNHKDDVALQLMEECAKQGDPVACYMTALWYKDGVGTHINLALSAKWLSHLEDLADGGNSEAQWELSQNYRFADLFPRNIAKANYWLERAAEGGFAEAQHHLAWYYETGQYDYPINPAVSIEWYDKAFLQEHPETLYLFGIRKMNNSILTDEAAHLLMRAAEKGFKQAEEILGSYGRLGRS